MPGPGAERAEQGCGCRAPRHFPRDAVPRPSASQRGCSPRPPAGFPPPFAARRLPHGARSDILPYTLLWRPSPFRRADGGGLPG
ncbi:Hypothetical protein RMHFA_04208 [Roseomonas mucosa]|uniref:Uncharacterized protein n=1 Tax=Roseomonas mucosa TaxID=207340 RepID=A0A4Y1MU95_9PROT|nr:hypothetical protein RADP37_04208 [Roseomonas mucosa]QDD93721.1 hypothetical protein HVIM_04208 [Roseomonas mucosa]QDD98824.1 hypothetical protein ADP8_04208 [Roseomonas mucosa]UZO91019.1 Hypothetical protein RMP42_04208 [Roseomonas mucosa]UZO95872.1 Hypothetical protein RMHFA_04208 [Roseomonas mucosa]